MNKGIELFKASFYADLLAIQAFVKKEEDLIIKIPVREGAYISLWSSKYVSISVLEILNWAAFGFYDYVEKESICHKRYDADDVQIVNDCINPSEHYKNIVNCIEWICNKFSIQNYHLKDYSTYVPLSRVLFEDEEFLEPDEMEEALKHGFQQMDLDLINAAMNGNGIKTYNLIKSGANFKTDPLDYSDESLIVATLSADISFHLLRLISYLNHKEHFSVFEPYEILSSLYQVGVSNYIIDIVTSKT